ncbi:MAG: phosphate acetyltransferase [Candidatus Omnitrophica bacterium]|nr:phosphate acetyltransferase [Candidatus Omnitrophota bacterium]
MSILTQIRERAKSNLQRIILCEAGDSRIIRATREIISQQIARIVLVGEKETILSSFSLEEIKQLEIVNSDEDPLYLSARLLKEGRADGLVAGATRTTADVLKSLISILGCKDSLSISGAFLMEVANCSSGEEGVFIFADCGVIPEPSAKQLANIAIASADLFRLLINKEPKVAMLSFSTNGSATHRLLDKVIEATNIVKEISPDLKIDGEIQADAALVPEIAERKFPGSKIKGKANVLIFPDLNSGNIAYKLTERLAKARAVGPLLQNLRKPVSDLSRGCAVQDIVDAVAVTAVRAAT